MTTVRSDVYSRVTDQIIAELEAGVRPWVQPWNAAHAAGEVCRPLRHNAVPYRGINVVLLWLAALRLHFGNPLWMSYKQAAELGGQVRKGAKGSLVVYADTFTRRETDAGGQEQEVAVPFLKSYTVFNCEQIDGLPAHYYAQAEQPLHLIERVERAERFVAGTGAAIRHGGGMAYYSSAGDYVQMPPLASFRTAEAYYATLCHELTHLTRHPSRLNREFGRQRWGDEGYAMEELVAELGAAFLCADLGLTLEIRDDHAAYIASWLKVLKNDKRAVFTAAGHAQRAADYLHGLQSKPVEKAA
ncbi:MAG TPA: zincin-like metallopeptidase domain-containing protein [Gemmataceae bacterium]|nr:zincin-like metallopeptidase domain-containing protein [Gemmataceae bacterium]